MNTIDFNLIADWQYSEQEWNDFVTIEKANKKEDNIYFGIGILVVCSIGLMILRGTSLLIGLCFSIPFAVLVPWMRMKLNYKHLRKNIKTPSVQIYDEYLQINQHKIEVSGAKKRIKNLKIIDSKNGLKLLEIDIQWLTRKGPTNDEYRVLIPNGKLEEAQQIVTNFNSKR